MECECEFWGERIAGGMPLTGLEPFPPWYWAKKENTTIKTGLDKCYFGHSVKNLNISMLFTSVV